MAEPFDTLLQVQEHDTTLDQLRHRIEALPERASSGRAARRQAAGWPRPGRGAGPGRRPGRPPAGPRGADRLVGQAPPRDRGSGCAIGEVSASRDLQAMDHEVHQLAERAAPSSRRRRSPCWRRRSRSTWPWPSHRSDRGRAGGRGGPARGGRRRGRGRDPRRDRRPRRRRGPSCAAGLPAELAERYERCGPTSVGSAPPGWWATAATAAT